MGMPMWSCQSVGGRSAAASLGWVQPVCKFGWGEETEGDQFTLRATVKPHLSLWILSDNKLASVLRCIRETQSQSKQQFSEEVLCMVNMSGTDFFPICPKLYVSDVVSIWHLYLSVHPLWMYALVPQWLC